MLTAGIDVGSASVKVAILRHEGLEDSTIVAMEHERYRRRSPAQVTQHAIDKILGTSRIPFESLAYVATTGEGDFVPRRHGHFYGMTTRAKGALYLCPTAQSVLDCGALHARAIRIDPKGRVLAYRMTSQCASGTGQFVENIARYLGVALEDVGALSVRATAAEPVSSICAVLAETDVINMVARGLDAATILRGIHVSVAGRLAKLLRMCRAASPLVLTGGMAADEGLVAALRAQLAPEGPKGKDGKEGAVWEVIAPPNAIYAGAIGAALWGAYRVARKPKAPALARKEAVHGDP